METSDVAAFRQRAQTAARAMLAASPFATRDRCVSATAETRQRAALSARRSMLALGAVYVSSRMLGLLREVGVAYFFGTSAVADRWSAAFVVASLAVVLASQATYAVAVRWLGQHPPGATPEVERAYAQVVAAVRRLIPSVSIVYAAAAPVIAMLIVGGFSARAGQTVLLSLTLLPTVGASMLASCANAKLTLDRRFLVLNAAQALYSAGALVGLVIVDILGPAIGPEPVALGWSLGNLAALLTVYLCARPVTLRAPAPMPRRELVRIGAPIGIAYSLVSVQGLTDQAVAGRLGTGSVAALAYADRLFLLPLGFVVAALGPMLLGSLTSTSHLGAAEVAAAARTQLAALTRTIAPVGVLFAGAVPLIVAHVYQYGAFRGHSTTTTVAALDGFSVGIAASALFLLFFRAMQAVAQFRAVVVITAGSVALNAALSVVLAVVLGIYGDTLATALTALGTIQLQIHVLGRELGDGWAREVRASTAVPVALACLASFGLTTAARAHGLTPASSMAAGAALAGAFWLQLRLKAS